MRHGLCKKCGKEAVHIAMSGGIVFFGDQDDDEDEESEYAGAELFDADVSIGIHVCFNCFEIEDVWIEHPREKIAGDVQEEAGE